MNWASLLFVTLLSFKAYADQSCLNRTDSFFKWLEENKLKFESCELKSNKNLITLCDGTIVDKEELKSMFKLSPEKLLEEINSKKVKVEILCDETSQLKTFKQCETKSNRNLFKNVTSLHGMHLPLEKVILIRSTTSPGSLIHEWIHFLQSSNSKPIYGRIYKKERNEIQNCLTKIMDTNISIIEKLEKTGKKNEIAKHLQSFMEAQSRLTKFSPWQDLIDERSIFVLYLKYGKDIGIPESDIELARKNMGFVCNRNEIKANLNPSHCNL